MRTSNPALNPKVFDTAGAEIRAEADRSAVMTMEGAINKTLLLLTLAVIPAAWVFTMDPQRGIPLAIGGFVVSLVLGLVLAFKSTLAPVIAPIYALAEGLFLGGITLIYERRYPGSGIAVQAIGLTFGVMFLMLVVYRTGLIKVTEKFKAGVIIATGALALFYLVAIVLSLFGVTVPLIHQGGPIGIAFSVGVVILAAFNLLLDFDFIVDGAGRGAPKRLEWYAAFGLMVTLVWLYIEVLRLLGKLRR